MEENTLILVGLPGDFASVKSKLELYFRNKRKSGGEISEIRNDPKDKRKALLIYVEDEAAKSVLEKGPHKVDFKALGVVELQVKPLQEDGVANVKRIKPVPLPRRPLEKEVGFGKSAPNIGEVEPGPFHQEGKLNASVSVYVLFIILCMPMVIRIGAMYHADFIGHVF
ncbi:hypothetical protein COCON_G00051380, partial [Conger conger]